MNIDQNLENRLKHIGRPVQVFYIDRYGVFGELAGPYAGIVRDVCPDGSAVKVKLFDGGWHTAVKGDVSMIADWKLNAEKYKERDAFWLEIPHE